MTIVDRKGKQKVAPLTRTGIIAAAAVASLGVFATAAFGVASAHRTVTISADGEVQALSGFYPDVNSALSGAGIKLGPADEVEPAVGQRIENFEVIEVQRARPYRVISEGAPTVQWSSAVSLDAVFDDVTGLDGSIGGKTGSVVVSRSNVRTALPLVHDARTVTVSVDNEPRATEIGGGETVAEILSQTGLNPSPLDEVRIERIDGQPALAVTTEQRGFSTKTEEIPHPTETVEDAELEKGTEVVVQEGANGTRTIKTYQQVRGGETVTSGEVSNEVTAEPVTQIVHVGTKEPAEATSSGPQTAPSGAVTDGDVWAALAQCESGGNPSANTGNGFYGMYQFMESTWVAVGGTGLPSDASAEEQTLRAQILQAQSGWGQWPACAASLGLL